MRFIVSEDDIANGTVVMKNLGRFPRGQAKKNVIMFKNPSNYIDNIYHKEDKKLDHFESAIGQKVFQILIRLLKQSSSIRK